jgi:6-pyruvoyltetrahydropterin/6-carboxytetrahydropterin synthase
MSQFEVVIRQMFSAAHALRNYHGGTEPLHGHNFEVEVVFRGKRLQNKVKYLVDFIEARQALQSVLQPLEHVNLNQTPPFDRENPSAENLAFYISRQMAQHWRTPGVKVASVTVWETPAQAARFLS